MIEVKCVKNEEAGGNITMHVSGDLADVMAETEEVIRGFYTGFKNAGLPASTLLKEIVDTVIKEGQTEE